MQQQQLSRIYSLENRCKNVHKILERIHLIHTWTRAFTALNFVRTQGKIRTILQEWSLAATWESMEILYGYDPIRPKKKKKKNYSCKYCGVKNDHYITTCPKKKRRERKNENIVVAVCGRIPLGDLDLDLC